MLSIYQLFSFALLVEGRYGYSWWIRLKTFMSRLLGTPYLFKGLCSVILLGGRRKDGMRH